MLIKLLKYDFKNLLLPCIPFYVGGLILSIIGMFLVEIIKNPVNIIYEITMDSVIHTASSIALTAITFLLVCIILFSLILVSTDFYHTVFAKRGYLIHTLPVSSKDILLSKIISGFVSITLSIIVVIALNYIMMYGNMSFTSALIDSDAVFFIHTNTYTIDSPEGMKFLKDFYTSIFWIVILSGVYTVFTIHISIALGHLTKHKVVGSIAIFFIFSNIINNIIIIPPALLFVHEIIGTVNNTTPTSSIFINPSILYCILICISSVVYYFITKHIVDKKLNLI